MRRHQPPFGTKPVAALAADHAGPTVADEVVEGRAFVGDLLHAIAAQDRVLTLMLCEVITSS